MHHKLLCGKKTTNYKAVHIDFSLLSCYVCLPSKFKLSCYARARLPFPCYHSQIYYMLLNAKTVTGYLQIWRISTIGLNLEMQPTMQLLKKLWKIVLVRKDCFWTGRRLANSLQILCETEHVKNHTNSMAHTSIWTTTQEHSCSLCLGHWKLPQT